MKIKILIALSIAVVAGAFVFWQSEKAIYKDGSLRENKKIKISDQYSFSFQFSEKPKIGTIIVEVKVFDKNGNKVNNLNIAGFYEMSGMPSKGSDNFMQNKQNNYLLPINIGMLGDWKMVIIFTENGQEIYRGNILFEV